MSNSEIYHIPILNALPPAIMAQLLSDGTISRQTYSKNEIVHLEGENCQRIEIILSGQIVVERIGIDGDLMTVNYFNRGDVIGANLIFAATDHYPMTITARQDSQVLILTKAILADLLKAYPDFMMVYLRIISDLSVLIGTKMKNRVSRTIRQSIMTYLRRQSQLQKRQRIRLTLSKKALAEMFGISRTSLSRELGRMRNEGLIDFDQKTITILDPDFLL